jgi:predicted RNase H-like nuclease
MTNFFVFCLPFCYDNYVNAMRQTVDIMDVKAQTDGVLSSAEVVCYVNCALCYLQESDSARPNLSARAAFSSLNHDEYNVNSILCTFVVNHLVYSFSRMTCV